MYVQPVLLPQFTNREDFVLPLSVFDDDLSVPINIAGITGSGTFNNWTVTDGTIVTASNTALTIPGYPIGSQLSAVALTVGAGLAINVGDPITIADQSGLNTMAGYVTSYAPSTGALVCQIGMTFQFEIRRQQHSGSLYSSWGYNAYPALGVYDESAPEITASLGNGIMITGLGYLQIMIPEAQMKTLRPGTRRASMTMTDSINTRQVFLAQLPILSGGVTN